MNIVTKSVTLPNVPEFAYKAMNEANGPLTQQNMLIQLFGGTARSYQEGTDMVYEVTGDPKVVDAAIGAVQEKVPEFVSACCNEALATVLLAMLSR